MDRGYQIFPATWLFTARTSICLFFILGLGNLAAGQDNAHWLRPADSLHQGRLIGLTVSGVVAYSGTLIGLSQYWYKDYPRSSFHTFNDWDEWEHLDKFGHVFTTTFESEWAYHAFRWTGVGDRRAIWYGVGTALLFQTTIEVLDGFSEQWGFSWGDFGANALGAGVFAAQQLTWGEQRIRIKFSSWPGLHPNVPVGSVNGHPSVLLSDRARDLFGAGLAERILKDYNGQTYWFSINPASFVHTDTWWPGWLNVAVGYGAKHMYGGYDNVWKDLETGARYRVDETVYPRQTQYYLSLDIDLARIPVRSRLLRAVFGMLNVLKVPAPALELTSRGTLRGHWMYF